ncbi:MAG TPA: hypothetical protein VLA49_09420 [Anaerolineales bacterium]|nr:hypothetical protein [Anaerolineales bacterium]
MRMRSKRLFGILLVLVGTLSLVFSAVCVVQAWRLRVPLQEALLKGLNLLDTTLAATTEALELAQDSIESASASADTLAATVDTLASSLQDTTPILNTLVTLVGEDFPQTIDSAKTSLQSAQTSARLIDSVLRALTIFNRNLYDPPVPLHIALGQVSTSLDRLPESFTNMESSLVATQDNLNLVQSDVAHIAVDIQLITTNLQSAQDVIAQYQQVLSQIQPEVAKLEGLLPRLVKWLAYTCMFIFTWLGIIQLGLLIKGWGMAFGPYKE